MSTSTQTKRGVQFGIALVQGMLLVPGVAMILLVMSLLQFYQAFWTPLVGEGWTPDFARLVFDPPIDTDQFAEWGENPELFMETFWLLSGQLPPIVLIANFWLQNIGFLLVTLPVVLSSKPGLVDHFIFGQTCEGRLNV